WNGLRPLRPIGLRKRHTASRCSARHIRGDPRLVQELPRIAAVHNNGSEKLDRVCRSKVGQGAICVRSIAVLFVVVVDEWRKEDDAGTVRSAIKGVPAVVKEAVGSGAHSRVCGSLESMER